MVRSISIFHVLLFSLIIQAGAVNAASVEERLDPKPGQDLMAGRGRWVSRKDGSYFTDLKGKKMQIPSLEWDDKQVELIKLYNSIFSLS
jgi:hypothetical protein